jgi:hypothetical protein
MSSINGLKKPPKVKGKVDPDETHSGFMMIHDAAIVWLATL